MSDGCDVLTCLWFESEAEEAARLYTSLLPDSRIKDVTRYGKDQPMPEGTVLTVTFELRGREFMALNGGPHDAFNDAHSMVVRCDSQAEIDRLWDALLDGGGSEQRCGWLKDRYGLSWQIVPAGLQEMIASDDAEAKNRMMSELLGMVKLDIGRLEAAYHG